MAKQLGPFKYEKTLGCITFYRRGDKWYARQKSSLSRRRVKTSKQFMNTMQSARRLGKAACLAGAVYDKLPEAWKMFELYQQLTGIATCSLKEGRSASDIRDLLVQQLHEWGYRKELQYPVIKPSNVKLRVRDFRKSKSGLKLTSPSGSKSGNQDETGINPGKNFTKKRADSQERKGGLRYKFQGIRRLTPKSQKRSVTNDNMRVSSMRKRSGSQKRIGCRTEYRIITRLNEDTG
ncbi:MAG: hypothetical protein QM731_08835 [Chitinophagaceae bacterium]